jgi:hypothetical protein
MTLPSHFRRAARWRDEGRRDPLSREASSNARPAHSNPSAALAAGPRAIAAIDEEAGLIESEALRDQLIAELSDLKSADEAADWVHKTLSAKTIILTVKPPTAPRTGATAIRRRRF